MVLDLRSTDPDHWDEDFDPNAHNRITDNIIYELHIRDLSMDKNSGICNKGKFLGVAEENTLYKGYPTGMQHIKDLGITHLHLLPVYDYGYSDEGSPLPALTGDMIQRISTHRKAPTQPIPLTVPSVWLR
jgi:pullulanase